MKMIMTCVAAASVGLAACGGGSGEAGTSATDVAPAGGADAAATTSEGFTRATFVLCEAIEPHREELASIVGFTQDADRDLGIMRSECVIHGDEGGTFARVSLLPALMSSVAQAVQRYEGEAVAVTEVTPDAMFVDVPGQPHVIFSMGPLLIDVDAENVEVPSRTTMVDLARRVHAILTDANPS